MHYVHQNGKVLFKHAVRQLDRTCRIMLERNHLKHEDIALFIMHQANIRIIEAVVSKLGLQRDRVITDIHKYGNTSAASIPLALSDAVECGRLREGDLVMFFAVGAGFTAGSILVRWG